MDRILLVEDNEDDVIFMKRALQRAQVTHPLEIVTDGQQAIEYFEKSIGSPNGNENALPCLVLLDLKLPRKNGLEVLEWIREQPALKSLIVLILSTSKEPHDLRRAYELGANAYLVKPAAVDQLMQLVKAIQSFWLTFVEFPPSSS